jgi:hypothetical protein
MKRVVGLLIGDRPVDRFGCVQGEIVLDEGVFPIAKLGSREYHNAYDADESGSLIRIDAIFTSGTATTEVPAFAAQDRTGAWRWLVRFRPTSCGEWTCRVRVLVWHPEAADKRREHGPGTSRLDSGWREYAFGFDDRDYAASPEAEQRFTVVESTRPGPLEIAEPSENRNYFYCQLVRDGRRTREPLFLAGLCRPWVTDDREWESGLDRETELFAPMARAGCNVLYHWMAPWETQIVHQSAVEQWPRPDGTLPPEDGSSLAPADRALAYKRYDQGRAQHMDDVLDAAERHGILVFVAVMPHPGLRDARHRWGGSCWDGPETPALPARRNGFQQIPGPGGDPISIDQFFMADPSGDAGPWSRRLWKHWANYWRYLFARWAAHPALGAWIVADELEGLGSSESWWWDNRSVTGAWHDSTIGLLRGALRWQWAGRDLSYSGDYLHHPVSSAASHYRTPRAGTITSPTDADLMAALANVEELPGRGDWNGHREPLSFVSHHAYPFVPCRGRWHSRSTMRQYAHSRWRVGGVRWARSSSDRARLINADRWLWDAICTRLAAWSRANAGRTRLITEYGCLERLHPLERWDEYGRRVPAFTHFANWAAFALGLAGTPFKWNDGASFGEMAARQRRGEPSAVWSAAAYPPDSYAEMTNLLRFVRTLPLAELAPRPRGGWVIDEAGREIPHLSMFTLASAAAGTMAAWLYDRTFESNGRALHRSVVLDAGGPGRRCSYAYFDTWAGAFLSAAGGSVESDREGRVILALPPFPTSGTDTVRGVADGNDLAIRLWWPTPAAKHLDRA